MALSVKTGYSSFLGRESLIDSAILSVLQKRLEQGDHDPLPLAELCSLVCSPLCAVSESLDYMERKGAIRRPIDQSHLDWETIGSVQVLGFGFRLGVMETLFSRAPKTPAEELADQRVPDRASGYDFAHVDDTLYEAFVSERDPSEVASESELVELRIATKATGDDVVPQALHPDLGSAWAWFDRWIEGKRLEEGGIESLEAWTLGLEPDDGVIIVDADTLERLKELDAIGRHEIVLLEGESEIHFGDRVIVGTDTGHRWPGIDFLAGYGSSQPDGELEAGELRDEEHEGDGFSLTLSDETVVDVLIEREATPKQHRLILKGELAAEGTRAVMMPVKQAVDDEAIRTFALEAAEKARRQFVGAAS